MGFALVGLLAACTALLVAFANERWHVGRRQLELETLKEKLESRLAARTSELMRSREQYRTLIESTQSVPWEMLPGSLRLSYVGPQALALLGYSFTEMTSEGFLARAFHREDRAEAIDLLEKLSADDAHGEVEARVVRADGRVLWLRAFASVTLDAHGEPMRRGVFLDVTARHVLEGELRAAQRLETVGRLAAGVAHEINTPVQFVSDSVQFVTDGVATLVTTVRSLQRLLDASPAEIPALVSEIRAAGETDDTEYVLQNLPDALESSVEGLSRIAAIVRALKELSHPDRIQKRNVDLNSSIRSTLTVAGNEYREVADLVTELGVLPPVACHAGEINQVIVNLVVNAAHAIADAGGGASRRGTITVRSRWEGESVLVSVTDTGAGIPVHIRPKVFDPFFTTKDVGKGTGQGLSLARTIVVEKHGGELTFESELGRGTTFLVRLPISEQRSERACPTASSSSSA
jgi:PAS domain S-box-containing protein